MSGEWPSSAAYFAAKIVLSKRMVPVARRVGFDTSVALTLTSSIVEVSGLSYPVTTLHGVPSRYTYLIPTGKMSPGVRVALRLHWTSGANGRHPVRSRVKAPNFVPLEILTICLNGPGDWSQIGNRLSSATSRVVTIAQGRPKS